MEGNRRKALAILVLGVSALVLSLFLVWLNIERAELGYELKELQTERTGKEALIVKLTVERDNLIAPHRLRRMAREMGLTDATPDQIRLMDDKPER